ncbi:thylakoid membrane photosystem I accumulation factor [Geitlerinema sp. CS-897]|uniref:thylakoid membrane photosystem I accumulation factor n=1 Tax=Baaleninema simplex TaxID=2862350 RepID=UPI0008FBEE1C|nr:thylakoid membrane photosystem I accumulation factor [Baaleninema simplex]MDC0835754.1 thylakoid membrane photosystem I accumulation factor [Geitlerinema sp. CS-897]
MMMRACWNWRRWLSVFCVAIALWSIAVTPAWAKIDDDKYDGNIFALYAGNGSLVPPKVDLKQSLAAGRPTLLVLYLDDSSDCKGFTTTVSQLQAYYGRVANFVPVNVDSIAMKSEFDRSDPGYYFDGFVPKTVVFDDGGEVRFQGRGQVTFETLDDVFREIFNLLPRSESLELKRRPLNEVNTELTE